MGGWTRQDGVMTAARTSARLLTPSEQLPRHDRGRRGERGGPPTTHVFAGENESPQVHLRVTRVPRPACSFGPTTLRLAPMGLAVPIMGPGATVGPVDSRVYRAHSPLAVPATASTKRLRTKQTA